MKAERAKWEAEVEELRREANKKPSAKHTAQQQVSETELWVAKQDLVPK